MKSNHAMPDIVSHIRKDESGRTVCQSNEEHCINVARLAEQFANEFGMGKWGYVLGLLHDKGKEKREFQAYIRHVNGIPGHEHWTDKGKNHAYVGALEAKRLYKKSALHLFCNQIASHHRGLYDYDELEKTLLQQSMPDEVKRMEERPELNRPPFHISGQGLHHLSRMLFSCLVDADYLDTEAFMDIQSSEMRGSNKSLQQMLPLLEQHLVKLEKDAAFSEVNAIRKQVQGCCRKKYSLSKGFYSLTVPTGGGKTLSSLLWAIHHAIYWGMRRIIIAIPYTSIIVQTATILKQIFGEDAEDLKIA